MANVQPIPNTNAPAVPAAGEDDIRENDYTITDMKAWIKKLRRAIKQEKDQRCCSLVDKLFCAFKFGEENLKSLSLENGLLSPLAVCIGPQSSEILQYKSFRALGQLCFGSSARCKVIAEDIDVLHALRHAVSGTHKMAKLNALGTLNNIASFSPESHDHLRFLIPLVVLTLDMDRTDTSSSAKKIRGLSCKTLHNLSCNVSNHPCLIKHNTIPSLVGIVSMQSQELSFAVVSAALTICALAGHEGSCPALATLHMCGTSIGPANIMSLMVRCFEAVLENNPDPNDVNVFHKDWKIAQGLSVLTTRPEHREELVQAGLPELLQRGLSRPQVDPKFVNYALVALWNLQLSVN